MIWMQIHAWKLGNDGNSESCKKVKMLTFDFEKSNFDKQYIQMWFESWEN